jgi:hypothetical protein
MAETENKFPTLRDLRDKLSQLVNMGLGDHPAQIIIVPDSTLQAVAKASVPEWANDKPALMVEFDGVDGRMPVLVYSTDRMQGLEMKSRASN